MQQQSETSQRPHGMLCQCGVCSRDRVFFDNRVQPVSHITPDLPSARLPASSVSVHELLDNVQLTLPPRYEIGEDWNDD